MPSQSITLAGNNYGTMGKNDIFVVIFEDDDYKFQDDSLKRVLHDKENNRKARSGLVFLYNNNDKLKNHNYILVLDEEWYIFQDCREFKVADGDSDEPERGGNAVGKDNG